MVRTKKKTAVSARRAGTALKKVEEHHSGALRLNLSATHITSDLDRMYK